MSIIVTRSGKGSTLSWLEMDTNLTNLNNDKLEAGSPASNITVTPVGGLTSTDVQAALGELDSKVTNKVEQTSTTGAAVIPTGTTIQRPGSPVEGHFRRNSELGQWEGYDGAQWEDVGGVSLTAEQTLSNKTLVTPNIYTSFNYTGVSGVIKVDGTTRVTIGSQGIEAGSFAPESITPTELSQKFTSGVAVTASGTAVDFTGIPSWAKRVTIVFSDVSTNGASAILIRLGTSGGVDTTGYASTGVTTGGTNIVTGSSSTAGFVFPGADAALVRQGVITLTKITGNSWVLSAIAGFSNTTYVVVSGGSKTLSGSLNRVRITTANGTDTLDAGTINIMWE